jgi:hypothetical protein
MLENSDLSIARMQRVDSRGKTSKPRMGELKGNAYHPIFLLLGAYGANATWCMRSEWWAKNAFFDGGACLDWRIALKAFPSAKISYTAEVLYNYRRHEDQVTNRRSFDEAEMTPVYSLWLDYAKRLGLSHAPYEIFARFAIPWNKSAIHPTFKYEEYANFRTTLLSCAKELSPTIFHDILHLARRRDAFAINRHNNFVTQIKLLKNSKEELLSVSSDLIFEAIRRAFH